MPTAIARRCCSPPDSSWILRSALSSMPSTASSSRLRSLRAFEPTPAMACGSSMLSLDERYGTRLRAVACQTNPTSSRRYCTSSWSEMFSRSRLPTRTWPGRRPVQAGEDVEQRALAATARADDGHHLGGQHLQVKAAQGHNLQFSLLEYLEQVAALDIRLRVRIRGRPGPVPASCLGSSPSVIHRALLVQLYTPSRGRGQASPMRRTRCTSSRAVTSASQTTVTAATTASTA